MDLDAFVQRLKAEFEELLPPDFHADMPFQDLEDWTSVNALILIALIQNDFNYTVNVARIRECATARDVYHMVQEDLANNPNPSAG